MANPFPGMRSPYALPEMPPLPARGMFPSPYSDPFSDPLLPPLSLPDMERAELLARIEQEAMGDPLGRMPRSLSPSGSFGRPRDPRDLGGTGLPPGAYSLAEPPPPLADGSGTMPGSYAYEGQDLGGSGTPSGSFAYDPASDLGSVTTPAEALAPRAPQSARSTPGSAPAERDPFGPQRSPEEVDALLDRITAEAEAQYDAEHPGQRAYHAARQANPEGRPFYTTELNNLPAEQAQHATTTLGGNWGNAFGELDNDPFLQTMRGADGSRPVTVQAPYMAGQRDTLYRQPSGQQVFGGDTTVRNIGGKNMFVDRQRGGGGDVGGAPPVPEGGYLTEREKLLLAKLDGQPMSVDKMRDIRKLGSGVNTISTYEYDGSGALKRDEFGNPIKNAEVAAQRADYLAEQKAKEVEGRDVSRRNYQLKQAGLRAVPLPDWMLERAAAENARLGGNQDIEREKIAAGERIAGIQADAQVRAAEAQAGRMGGENDLKRQALIASEADKLQAANPQLPRAEAIAQAGAMYGAAPGGAPGGAPPPASEGIGFAPPDRAALEAMRGYTNRIIDYGKQQGWTPVQIDQAVRQYGGDLDRQWYGPNGGFWADWLPGGANSNRYARPWSGSLPTE